MFRLFGVCFWIFPNLDDESLGFFASFKPVYSFVRLSDGKLEILLRLIGILALIGLGFFVSQDPTVLGGN